MRGSRKAAAGSRYITNHNNKLIPPRKDLTLLACFPTAILPSSHFFSGYSKLYRDTLLDIFLSYLFTLSTNYLHHVLARYTKRSAELLTPPSICSPANFPSK
jgi:hypothetical protein